MLIDSQAKKLTPQLVSVATLTAAGSGDNTEVENSAGIDCKGYDSALIIISGTATLTDTKKLDLKDLSTDDSEDNSTFADKETLVTNATLVTSSGGGAETGLTAYTIDLDDYDRYLKVAFTPDLTHTSTDTATLTCQIVLCGKDELPPDALSTTW